MKVLRFIEACLICACFIPFTVLILLLLFPFSLTFEIVSIIHEIFTYDRYEHGWYVDTIKVYNRIILGQNQKLSLSTRNIISVGDSRETQYHFETHRLLTSRVDSNISSLFELANMDNLSRYYFYYKRKEIK